MPTATSRWIDGALRPAARHMYRPEGISFDTRGKVVTARWSDPATLERPRRLPAHPISHPTER